jgi:hypothetical protein
VDWTPLDSLRSLGTLDLARPATSEPSARRRRAVASRVVRKGGLDRGRRVWYGHVGFRAVSLGFCRYLCLLGPVSLRPVASSPLANRLARVPGALGDVPMVVLDVRIVNEVT